MGNKVISCLPQIWIWKRLILYYKRLQNQIHIWVYHFRQRSAGFYYIIIKKYVQEEFPSVRVLMSESHPRVKSSEPGAPSLS